MLGTFFNIKDEKTYQTAFTSVGFIVGCYKLNREKSRSLRFSNLVDSIEKDHSNCKLSCTRGLTLSVGKIVGDKVGEKVGDIVGSDVGDKVGYMVGCNFPNRRNNDW